MLVYAVNFQIIIKYLNNILLNVHCKILKIERVKVNLRRRLEKMLFYCVHHNSQQNHVKQKNQNAFVEGGVSRGNPGRIFKKKIRSTWKPKNRFPLKKSANLLL